MKLVLGQLFKFNNELNDSGNILWVKLLPWDA